MVLLSLKNNAYDIGIVFRITFHLFFDTIVLSVCRTNIYVLCNSKFSSKGTHCTLELIPNATFIYTKSSTD